MALPWVSSDVTLVLRFLFVFAPWPLVCPLVCPLSVKNHRFFLVSFRWIGGTRVWSLVVSDKSSLAGVNPSTLAKYYHFELQLKNWAGQKIVVEKFTFGQNGRFYRHIIKNGFISIIEAEEHCKRNDLDCHFKLGTTVPNFVKLIDIRF